VVKGVPNYFELGLFLIDAMPIF